MFKTAILIPGRLCNLRCPHCYNSSSPEHSLERFSDLEIERTVQTLNKHRIQKITLTGGEPTLYLDQLLSILNQLDYDFQVTLTTNGWFVNNEEKLNQILSSIPNLELVQLSVDEYHSSFSRNVPIAKIKNYCNVNNIEFCVIVAIQSAKELLLSQKLSNEFDVQVYFQPIDSCGEARKTKSYFKHQVLDESVLDKKCPNSDALNIMGGKGYSHCCNHLVYNEVVNKQYYESTISDLVESNYYKEHIQMTMRERLVKSGISIDQLKPEHSSVCQLCEYIEAHNMETSFAV